MTFSIICSAATATAAIGSCALCWKVLSWCFFFVFFSAHFHFPASGQAVVTGVIPSPPRFLPSIFFAHRVQQSHCSSIVHRMLLTHALALSASQFVHKKKSQQIYTSMHSAGLELTKLTYTRLEDNLIRHRGDRLLIGFREPFPGTFSIPPPPLARTDAGRGGARDRGRGQRGHSRVMVLAPLRVDEGQLPIDKSYTFSRTVRQSSCIFRVHSSICSKLG